MNMLRRDLRRGWAVDMFVLNVLLAVLAHEGAAVSVEQLPLDDIVRGASVVSRVRVLDREPVLFEFEGKEQICGYRYRAEVVHSFKGPHESVEFFASNPGDFGAIGDDHFVIASQMSAEERRAAAASTLAQLHGVHRKRLLCEISAGEIFVRDGRQMLIPFDKKATEMFGEDEWLRVSRLSVVSNVEFEMREVETSEAAEPYAVVRWSDVEKTILTALRKD